MLKIAVVDDEIVFVESLINKITAVREKLNLEFKIDKYSNGFDILENYSKYHLIFLILKCRQLTVLLQPSGSTN